MGKRILVTRSSMPPYEEYCEEIADLWESHWLTNVGAKHQQLEAQLREYLKVQNIALFTNGHSALECVLEAMLLGRDGRSEVITTPFTFASTTNAIVRKGLEPVFCDIKPDDYTIDPAKIEALITDRTCAIVPVHVYGNLCDEDAIQAIANRHGLKVIYDAAHAFGIERDGVGVGSFGDASMFSFHATKVFNTIEGGAVAYSDPALGDALAQWRNFGLAGQEEINHPGGNYKMNEFAAAMGLCNLRHVNDEIAKRRAVAEEYWRLLDGIPGIAVCHPPANVKHNYAYFPVLFDLETFGTDRDTVFEQLDKAGIGARKYFYPLTCDSAYFPNGQNPECVPNARYASSSIIALPMYSDLSSTAVRAICDTILKIHNQQHS